MKTERTKKKSLRDELIREGIIFLKEHSIEELTMRKIAELCHVTPHAIYNHFKNKDELIVAINDALLKGLTKTAIDALTKDSADFTEKMTRFAVIYLDLLEKYPFHISMLHQNTERFSPYYELIPDEEGRIAYFDRYPGFPTLKTLQKICTLPPVALKGLLKLGQMASRLKKSPSEIVLEPDKAETARGQLILYSFMSGLQNEMHSGMIPEQGQEAVIGDLLRLLFRYIL